MSLIDEIADRVASTEDDTDYFHSFVIVREALQNLILELPSVLSEIFNENGWTIQDKNGQVMLYELFEKIREKTVD